MNRVAWWTCALIALIDARIYERCELAQDLQALGVAPGDIATWVCIAYHESRFDTDARNSYSGDHGIFQISELYWCGPGKACGLPCSALRDEDISDDLECALQVHEEHTRLQGNGFLAWVVYPQHCKHNTKKYLVDCDMSVKSPSPFKPRTYTHNDNFYSNFTRFGTHNIEGLLPPYLAVGALFRENYGKVQDRGKSRVDWFNYKVDNIDELKLPVFDNAPASVTTLRTTTTTTSTTYIPPVKPWRTIETNQFRKKQFNNKPTTKKEDESPHEYSTPTTSTMTPPSTTMTTLKPLSVTSTALPNVATTTLKPTISTTTWRPSWPFSSFSSTYRAPTQRNTETQSNFTTTTAWPRPVSTPKPVTTTWKPYTTSTSRIVSTSTYKPFAFTYKPWFTTTDKPTLSWFTFTSRTASTTPATTKFTQAFSQTTTTSRPFTTTATPKPVTTTWKPVPTATKSWKPITTTTTTPKPVTTTTTTRKPVTTTTTRKPETTTKKPRTTQNIFDFYLNPTKPPTLRPFQFSSDSKKFRLKIFSDGTTTAAPNFWRKSADRDSKPGYEGAAKNYIRRQTPESHT